MKAAKLTAATAAVLLLLLLIAGFPGFSRARSISSLEAPRGCSWRHEAPEDVEPSFSASSSSSSSSTRTTSQQQLVCRLRTIAGAASIVGNLSGLQAESVSSLGLECNEALFFESQLEPAAPGGNGGAAGAGFLGSLPRLERLRVEHCKIRNLPGGAFAAAPELRRLSLRSHNADWSSAAMELHRDALRGLAELRELDLGENNVWSLPSEFLCPTPGLTTLNLTSNRLQDVASLGLADWSTGCAQSLEALDLSGNDLSALPDNGLAALRALTTLKLQDNAIAAVGDHALAGLANLRSLNVSSNRLVALPPELFAKTRELREIVLSNNSLTVLAPGLLDALEHLQTLDLSGNELTSQWVNRDTFSKLAELMLLDLSFNALTKIDAFVFRGLTQLQVLNLEHNQIDTLAEDCFGSLGNLRSLALSHNKIVRFEAAHGAGLALLDQLFIDENKLLYVHPAAFANLTNLQDLRLSGNSLTEVPLAVKELRELKTLDLGNNRIADIGQESFVGLDKLSGLRLVDNKLENISRKAVSNLPSLQILNLASNAIRHVEQGAFSMNNLLIAIRLDGNQLTEIHGVFRNLPSLLMLNISDNNLLWFNYGDLPPSLEWLDMHSNQISDLGSDFSGGRDELRIKKLDVSYNRIEEISDISIPNSVEKLYLNDNRIRTIAAGTFMHKTSLRKVVLSGNDITHMDVAAIELQPVPSDRELPMFYIGGNPILCDCTMEWLPRINELSRMRQHPRFMDLEAVTCDMVHARAAPKRPLLSLKPKDFACRYQSHCFAICHCCDFDACDCEMTCPDNCSCYHDHSWSSNVVDCSNAGYRLVPERIPMDATEIYLDGNDLGDLGSHVFIGKRKLEVLFLNNSGISGLHNRTFNGAESLKVLHLESNALRELKGYEFDQLEHVHELYLDHNAIAAVSNATFRKMKNLEVLRLNNNRIVDFRPWEAVVSHGASVSLEGNAWSCDCANAGRLRAWLAEHRGDLAERMYCRDGVETIAQAIQRCGDPATEAVSISIHQPPVIGGNFVPLLAGALVVIIGVCLLVAMAFAFRQDVRLWAHARYGLRLGKMANSSAPEEERDRLYDGYLVYSERDEDFITRCLAAELEQSGLGLCLHYRDLPPTRPQESLPPAAAAARRIIIAFSPVFYSSEWQHPEFRAALRLALEQIRPSSRRRRVILLLATEAPTRDPELQLLLQTCTVIVWGEKRFWEKLRFAMPDSADLGKRKPAGCHPGSSNGIPARYSAAPSVVVDAWSSKPVLPQPSSPSAPPSVPGSSGALGAGTSTASSVLVAPLHAPTPTPTQSTYVSSASSRTEDEDSGHEQQLHHHHHHHHHHPQQQQQQQQQQLPLHHHHHLQHHSHLQPQQPQHHHQAGYHVLHPSGSAPGQRPASVASRSSHLYSTIPELAVQANSFGNPQMPINPRTYFV